MMLYRIILVLWVASACVTASAQVNSTLLADKYAHYRERLVTRFMVVGPGPGESIPAGIRNLRNWDDGEATALHWGDATLYLGWYIGVLATEYHLVQQAGGDPEATSRELFYALHALDRLDSVAETKWGLPGQLDGFLVRDDVPFDFVVRHPELNAGLHGAGPWTTGKGTPGVVRTLYSDHSQPMPHAFSQDQICHLLMGLALTKKFAGGSMHFSMVNDSGVSDTVHFDAVTWASAITRRIVVNLQRKGKALPWQLLNPDGTAVTNARGGDCRANASGIAAAARFITGQQFTDFLTLLPLNLVWQSQQVLEALRLNSSSLHMALVIAATGDSWRGMTGQKRTLRAIMENACYPGGAFAGMRYRKNDYGWANFYSYLLVALHRDKKIHFASSIDLLLSAPDEGPFYHSRGDLAQGGWAASRRFIDNPGRQENGSDVFPGNYNGLDFLLFYNLFLIADSEGVNYRERYITHRIEKPGY